MSVARQGNWLGQQRVDIPHLRAIESAVAGDFDLLAGSMLAGKMPLITSGFYVLTTGITLATDLKIRVAGGSLIHFLASESGSIFHVPEDRDDEQLNSTNPRVLGSFTPSQVNYVGLDFIREADDTTVDLVEFIDTQSLRETPVQVPLARTTDYRIVISTLDFDNNPGVCPIAKVLVDSVGAITTIEDSRSQMFRLGAGGTLPNIYSSFAWPDGRKESLNSDTFTGGDKGLSSLKQWMDGIMSRLWEVGGGEFWYSPTNYANERLARQGDPFVSNGEYFEWDGVNLHWQGLVWIFANSSGVVNEIADKTGDEDGLTNLVDGECIYVDVDRTTNKTGGEALTAVKGSLALLGSPTIPGTRYVLAWCHDDGVDLQIYTRDQSYAVNSAFTLATVAAAGMVKLSATNGTATYPAQVATVNDVGFYAFAAGLGRGGDFFGGAGDITIGGWSDEDHNVILSTTADNYETFITAENNYLINGVAALTVRQLSDYESSGSNLLLRLQGYDGTYDFQVEDRFHFETGGAMSWGIALGPAAPANTSTVPLIAKTFFRTNGASTPDTRDQQCTMDRSGNVTVTWESEPY